MALLAPSGSASANTPVTVRDTLNCRRESAFPLMFCYSKPSMPRCSLERCFAGRTSAQASLRGLRASALCPELYRQIRQARELEQDSNRSVNEVSLAAQEFDARLITPLSFDLKEPEQRWRISSERRYPSHLIGIPLLAACLDHDQASGSITDCEARRSSCRRPRVKYSGARASPDRPVCLDG
jgi:hypothetical protein